MVKTACIRSIHGFRCDKARVGHECRRGQIFIKKQPDLVLILFFESAAFDYTRGVQEYPPPDCRSPAGDWRDCRTRRFRGGNGDDETFSPVVSIPAVCVSTVKLSSSQTRSLTLEKRFMKTMKFLTCLGAAALCGLSGLGRLAGQEAIPPDDPKVRQVTVCFLVDCNDGSGRKTAKGTGGDDTAAKDAARADADAQCPNGWTKVPNGEIPVEICEILEFQMSNQLPAGNARSLSPGAVDRVTTSDGTCRLECTIHLCGCELPSTVGFKTGGENGCVARANMWKYVRWYEQRFGRKARCVCWRVVQSPCCGCCNR